MFGNEMSGNVTIPNMDDLKCRIRSIAFAALSHFRYDTEHGARDALSDSNDDDDDGNDLMSEVGKRAAHIGTTTNYYKNEIRAIIRNIQTFPVPLKAMMAAYHQEKMTL